MNVGDESNVGHKGGGVGGYLYTLLPLITCVHVTLFGTLSHNNHEPTEYNFQDSYGFFPSFFNYF
jgi:hypothetical protein